MTTATIWNDIDAALAVYEDSEADRVRLALLVEAMTNAYAQVDSNERERCHELGAEALYQLGRLDEVIAWSTPPSSPRVGLWLGHALFDLQRYREAEPLIRAALELSLQQWARAKLQELLLCCAIYEQPDAVAREVDDLRVARRGLSEVYAPIMIELLRAFDWARENRALSEAQWNAAFIAFHEELSEARAVVEAS